MQIDGHKSSEGIVAIFDVASDFATKDVETKISIISTASASSFIKSGKATNGVVVNNWFAEDGITNGYGHIESMYNNEMYAEYQVDEYIELIQDRVKAWLNDSRKNTGRFQTAMDVFKKGSTAQKNALMSIYTSQNIGIKYDSMDIEYTGTNRNDLIIAGESSIVNGGKGDDKILAGSYTMNGVTENGEEYEYEVINDNITMNGGDGNDVLTTSPIGTLNAGKGTNVMNLTNASEVTIEQGGGADYLHYDILTSESLSFEKYGDDLHINSPAIDPETGSISIEGSSSVIIKDHFKDAKKASLKGIAFSDTEVDYESMTAGEIVNAVKNNSTNINDVLKNAPVIDVYAKEEENNGDLKGTDIAGVYDNILATYDRNDNIYGYNGVNHIYLTAGYNGHDVIYSGKGRDILHFDESTAPETIEMSRDGNHLIIRYNASTLTINDYYKLKGKTSISEVRFGENSTYTLQELVQTVTDIGRFHNSITMNAVDNSGWQYDLNGNDTIKGVGYKNVLYGGNGNDTIYTGNGNNNIYAGQGNDKMYGQGGTNTYHFNHNDGTDIIYAGKKDITILDFSQITNYKFDENGMSPVEETEENMEPTYIKQGNDLLIRYANSHFTNNSVILSGFFKSNAQFILKDCMDNEINLRDARITILENGTTINGTAQDDYIEFSLEDSIERTISTGNGDDIIHVGSGNTTVKTGAGSDDIHITYGDHKIYAEGNKGDVNTIYFDDVSNGQTETTIYAGKGNDVLNFANTSFSDLDIYREGNNLVVSISNGNYTRAILADYFKGNHSVDKIITTDGETSIKELDNLLEEIVADPNKKANITGTVLRDNITGTMFNDTINGGDGNDTIHGGAGNDTLIGGAGNDTIYGDAGNDTFKGGDGDDVIYVGGGNNKIYGEADTNHIHFSETFENCINTIYGGKGEDILYFDKDFNELSFGKNGNHLEIQCYYYDDENNVYHCNMVVLNNYFKGGHSVNEIHTTDGTHYLLNEENLVSYELGVSSTTNSILGIKGSILKDRLNGTDKGETINAGDNDDYVYAGGGNDVINGGNGDDTIYDETGNDTIKGGNGNDKIYVGAGNNKIYGEASDAGEANHIYFNKSYFMNTQGNYSYGEYTNTVYAGKGNDILHFEDTNFGDLEFTKSGNNLIITREILNEETNETFTNKVIVADYFKGKHSVNEIVAADGTHYLDQEDLAIGEITGSGTINGTVLRDYIIGSDKNDTINAGDNKDIIYAGGGNDVINGGNGDDTIYDEAGNDTIKGGNGNDEIYVGEGNNKIYGEADTNNIYLSYTEGNYTNTIYSGKGNDILNFTDVSLYDLEFSRSGNNLIITRYYDNLNSEIPYANKVVLADYFRVKHSVDTIITADQDYNVFSLLEMEDLIGELEPSNPNKAVKITGTVLKETIHGTEYNDTLNGVGNNDVIYGYGGHDTLLGGDGDDEIYGGDGNDIIKAGNDDGPANDYSDSYGDEIYAGKDNDKIYGEGGYNRIYFSSGDGNDTIYMGNGKDEIHFDETVSGDSISFRGSGNNLVISYGEENEKGEQSTVTIANYFSSSYKSVQSIVIEAESFTEINLEEYIVKSEKSKWVDLWDGRVYSSNKYTGTEYADFIYTNSTNAKVVDEVYAGAGDDIIHSNSKFADMYGGNGNDTYIIGSLANSNCINDVGNGIEEGGDTIIVGNNHNDINFMFDVVVGDTLLDYDQNEFSELFIMNNSNLNKMIKTKMFENIPNTSVYDYFNRRGDGDDHTIEVIESKDGYYVTSEALETVKSQVAGWLSGTRYGSALDVLYLGRPEEVETLLELYQGVNWQEIPQ